MSEIHRSHLPLGQILAGDSVEILAALPEKSVDMVFADPPYNLQLQKSLWRPNMTRVDAVKDHWDHFDSLEAYDAFTLSWLQACRRVLKEDGTLWVIGTYHNIFRVGKVLMDLGFWVLNDVVWVKTNPMPNFRGVRFTNAHETLVWAQKHKGAKYTFNYQGMKALNEGKQMRSDWELPICKGKERIRVEGEKVHSTQKPEALLYRVISASTNPGDVILDPFFGSGTTGAVAKRLHRHWIGIEKDPTYIAVAEERIASIEPEPFDEEVFMFDPRRNHSRVAFRLVVESGLLQPGGKLYFGYQGEIQATILANARLRCGELTGSIHQVARQLKGSPTNGWDHWFYLDRESGEKLPIDTLRQKFRALHTSH